MIFKDISTNKYEYGMHYLKIYFDAFDDGHYVFII